MAEKTGYLYEKFRLFHVCDKKSWTCPYHYHDFDKITLFLQGHVTYDIEGTSYVLQPFDVVVIPAGQIHRPVISGDDVYERIIAYLSPSFIDSFARRGFPVRPVFQTPSPILRQHQEAGSVYSTACRLCQAWSVSGPAGDILKEAIFTEFLIYLTQAVNDKKIGYVHQDKKNEKIVQVMDYIAAHLTEKLTISSIARACFLSPDYIMHLFKEETGLSIGQYITTKRLQKARHLIEEGRALTTVCYDCGFTHYSTFYRAWKKQYAIAPKYSNQILDSDFTE